MKKFLIAAAGAGAVCSTSAMANEGRIEARGGIVFMAGNSDAIGGVAAGYDFDLGQTMFIGAEASADKALTDGANVVFGLTGRVGLKLGEPGKLYLTGGYSFDDDTDVGHIGAGYQHKLSNNIYGKIEYRRLLVPIFNDANTVVAGLGVAF